MHSNFIPSFLRIYRDQLGGCLHFGFCNVIEKNAILRLHIALFGRIGNLITLQNRYDSRIGAVIAEIADRDRVLRVEKCGSYLILMIAADD